MFTKAPSYLWRKSSNGAWHLKLPIPPGIRHHFPGRNGRPREHIVEPLHTGSRGEAEKAKWPLLTHYKGLFAMAEGRAVPQPRPDTLEAAYARAKALREDRMEVMQRPDDAAREAGEEALDDMAVELAEVVEAAAGTDVAAEVYQLATTPQPTILEALAEWNADAPIRESTKAKRELVVRELMHCLRMNDCRPAYVTEDRAAAFVRWLNAQALSYSTKQDRLSYLNGLWQYLGRRRIVPKKSALWQEHELTGKAADGSTKRGWTPDELVRLFTAPDESTSRTNYTRSLFRELYALGLLTGARLDSIVSLTPADVQPIKGTKDAGYWLAIRTDKTEAGTRTIPVVHPAAVAVLKRRLKGQPEASVSLFPECRPGGPDGNLSHHVSKALGRDRDRLGFGPEVDFHSTRRCFATVMENAGVPLIYAQRYIGHAVSGGGLMTGTYSDGASQENLLSVARAVNYPEAVQVELAQVAGT